MLVGSLLTPDSFDLESKPRLVVEKPSIQRAILYMLGAPAPAESGKACSEASAPLPTGRRQTARQQNSAERRKPGRLEELLCAFWPSADPAAVRATVAAGRTLRISLRLLQLAICKLQS